MHIKTILILAANPTNTSRLRRFSPNGKMLATASADNTVRLWRWDFDYLQKKGCDFIREYFNTNPPEDESDRHMCDGIGSAK